MKGDNAGLDRRCKFVKLATEFSPKFHLDMCFMIK
jgi:hypothetical protein